MIKVVSDLRQVGGFSAGTPVSSTNKTDRHDIAEILLKVALNTIKQTTKKHYRVCLSTHAPVDARQCMLDLCNDVMADVHFFLKSNTFNQHIPPS